MTDKIPALASMALGLGGALVGACLYIASASATADRALEEAQEARQSIARLSEAATQVKDLRTSVSALRDWQREQERAAGEADRAEAHFASSLSELETSIRGLLDLARRVDRLEAQNRRRRRQ